MAASQKLPPMYVELAKTQLGEDPKNVDAHVEAFRRWLSSMPHLTCPDDDEFLLMFLRHSKYVHAKAQARLDNFCTLSARKYFADSAWTTPVDLRAKSLEDYLRSGLHLPLGYMEDGKVAVWLRTGFWNPDEIPLPLAVYYAYKLLFMVCTDARTMIAGGVVVIDFTGGTSKQLIRDPNDIRTIVRFGQEAVPGRPQRIIFHNESKIVDTMLAIFMYYTKDKMKRRMVRSGADMNKVFEAEPGLRALLPPEANGEGRPLKELIRTNKKRFHEFYAKGDPTATIQVDESKRPSSARDFLREYKDYNANVMGSSGIYIRTNTDEI